MNTTEQDGFFTIEDMDRMNLKTMANPLHEPWNGQHLMALLVTVADLGIQGGISPAEAKADVVSYYCTNTSEKIVSDLEVMSKTPEFQAAYQLQQMMHENPEAMARAFEAIKNGWRPGDPT
ncbi:hypothetical protein N8654_03180 [Synechococcus sp. AH-601-B19]|nr:hypothetical protein [Synechococcus sp. AH-601-B19]